MSIITVNNLTRDYGKSKGVFDVSFSHKRGEEFGFCEEGFAYIKGLV